ncbi:MAG: GreA/GreB family elongation factor [Verrucomicrobia bacterium]|nr:GreA/GreB family elongation factor [Verrucomicrobiota bacterium]
MAKSAVVAAILDQLTAEAELYDRAARAAHAEATDEQSKAENKYDTRGLEASYLARGQSRQAAEVGQALVQFRALPLGESASVEVGALVQLTAGRDVTWYFLGPRAGGLEVTVEGQEITVITPQSPLGSQLLGRREGDRISLNLGGKKRECRIAKVC